VWLVENESQQPCKKKRKRTVAPKITKATIQQINAAKELKKQALEFRSAA
jgi:hypothetical protein